MTEEKKGVSNGPASSEMAPQEDGTKVPLTNEEPEVKFTSTNNPPNGDAKVDMGTAPTFSGLTKEDLMKYADDPFWVRLRWALFILFWAGWVVMLVVAIVIIIQAPRCPAKETLEWVQESAMIQYDANNPIDADDTGTETPEDLIKMAADLGVTTVYLEDLISPDDFSEINPNKYKEGEIINVLAAAEKAGLHVVTDFVPTQVNTNNSWYNNTDMKDYFKPGTTELDFSNVNLLDALAELLSGTWKGYKVQGFLMANAPEEEDEMVMKNASIILNKALEDVDGAVVYGQTNVTTLLEPAFDVNKYKEFLMKQNDTDNWTYFKYNPNIPASSLSKEKVQLVTLSLFMVPGTPILDGFTKEYFDENSEFIKSLSGLRGKESVQVGNITFAETTDDVIAYARVMKGTPGYAVAVNMNDVPISVNFTSIEGVPGKGDNELKLTTNATLLTHDLGSSKLDEIPLEPNEGIVVQFVPNF